MESVETQRRFIELRASGVSYAKIAEELGLGRTTLIGWSKKFDIQIKNYRAIEYEKLCEEYLICREHRIRVVGTQLSKITEEILNRDLSDVPTHRLYEIQTRLGKELEGEGEGIVFVREKSRGVEESLRDLMTKKEEWQG